MRLLILNVLVYALLPGCKNNVKTGLPYFNDPDFTPVWFAENDPAIQKLHTIPPFALTDQNGQLITNKTTTGKIYVANFFFTRCGNICPKMTDNMHKVADVFANDSNVMFISHSVMPAFDQTSVLRKYAKDKNITNPNWHLLTGSQAVIYTLAREGYFADAATKSAITLQFLHTENFILVDKHGHIRGVYNGTIGVEVNNLVKHIQMLKAED
jgi:protein SCO1/2